MSKPVYVLYMFDHWTEAWYQLSKEEQKNLLAKMEEASNNTGMKWIIACNSRWADEGVFYWSVAEYPDMETLQKKTSELEKLEWWRYISSKSILGTKDGE